MKVRTGGRTVEIPDERMRKGGVEGHAKNDTTRNGLTRHSEMHDRAVVKSGTAVCTALPRCGEQVSSPAPSSLPGWPKPTDKWNASYAQFLELEKQAGRIKCWFYEPFSLWLVRPDKAMKERGLRHKVDFMVWYPDGLERRLEMVEVKGYSRGNFRDGISRYKMARAMFPCFDWRMVKRRGHGWEDITV